ncbi:MAG TPA: hypothetical protein VG367_01345 [Mucilaginibacter sp.]|jgi:hypothetical protein|nr:hypothetical protein [Mucilaginibacter sp.]
MKKENVPQDEGALGKVTKEVCYATDSSGKYTTQLSSGWQIKSEALDVAWKDVEQRIAGARQRVLNGEASPLLFFMELRLMDMGILSDYTGYWKWQIKRHLRPEVFKSLSDRKLQKYAETFNVTVEELKTMTVNET